MPVTGALLIGADELYGKEGELRATHAATGAALEPQFHGASEREVDGACRLAQRDFDLYRQAPLPVRAQLLDTIADELMALGDELVERATAETALPRARIEGERARTCGQLRLFASLVREGRWLGITVDTPLPERKPLPRPDLRSRRIPLGPVAVFGASNFPLAFSVAGGDTASALAAGCPVVAKSHPSHLGTSELAGRAIQQAVKACGLPAGTFSLVYGAGNEVGAALVQHPAIQAVGFTGSRRGGQALLALAQARPQPIPVFAEMSSINPVFLFPAALAARGAAIAAGLVASATLGVGQFCTKPGLVFGIAGSDFDRFARDVADAATKAPASSMLNGGIHAAFAHGVGALRQAAGVELVAAGQAADGYSTAQAAVFRTTGTALLQDPALREEVFGPATLLVGCASASELLEVAERLEGQLTATLHVDAEDYQDARPLLPILERKAGRVLVNGFPTGVEVSYAMVHGGPHPATSDARVTSVGAMAIERFLRPVCYQDFPEDLLPPELQSAHLTDYPRLVDGKLEPSEQR